MTREFASTAGGVRMVPGAKSFSAVISLLLVISCGPSSAPAQPTFTAISPVEVPLYHINFSKLYFESPAVEQATRMTLGERLARFTSGAGKVTGSARRLLAALKDYESLLVDFYRHDDYLWLHYNVDDRDRTSGDAFRRIESEMAQTTGALEDVLRNLDPAKLSAYEAAVPGLAPYGSYLQSLRREVDHVLDPEGERLLSALDPLTTGWQYPLYSEIRQSTRFGTVATSNGALDVLRDHGLIRADPDPGVRAAGFEQLMAGFRSHRDLYAFALIDTAKAGNRLARLHHFEDAPAALYFHDDLSEEQVTDLLERVAAASDLNKAYEALLAERYKTVTGAKVAHSWDRYAPIPGTPAPRFTILEATQAIEAALAPLGTEYGDALAALLDPRNGRMDIVPGANRRSGGFSTGFIGTPSAFYTSEYQGYYPDVGRLAHESTHAVQRTLMTRAGVLPVYAEGPHVLSESFAEFSELLLADYLYRRATDPALKEYYLRQFLDIKGIHELYSASAEASLEQKIYRGVKDGSITDADDLDNLTIGNDARYSIWPGRDAGLEGAWMTKSLFYEDPLYTVNYVYAALLAIKYIDMYEKNPSGFVQRYVELMREGYTAPPDELLRRHLRIDLYGRELLQDALAAYRRRIDDLQRLYRMQG